MSDGDGGQWVPPIKSRQPGSVKSADTTKATTSGIKESDSSPEVSIRKSIGYNLGSQLQQKDTGIHIQP